MSQHPENFRDIFDEAMSEVFRGAVLTVWASEGLKVHACQIQDVLDDCVELLDTEARTRYVLPYNSIVLVSVNYENYKETE